MEYLKGKKWVMGYRIVYIVMVFIGSVMNLALVWNLADCMNALMAIPRRNTSGATVSTKKCKHQKNLCGKLSVRAG